jgi:hypothetical protein
MASTRSLEIARDLVVAWLATSGAHIGPSQVGQYVGDAYKALVRVVEEAEREAPR